MLSTGYTKEQLVDILLPHHEFKPYPNIRERGFWNALPREWQEIIRARGEEFLEESHNHNDVGNFIIYADGKPAIIDVGVETDTAKTFSPSRYDIRTMQSQYHNLPIVNGIQQQAGENFRASDVRYAMTDELVEFSLPLGTLRKRAGEFAELPDPVPAQWKRPVYQPIPVKTGGHPGDSLCARPAESLFPPELPGR